MSYFSEYLYMIRSHVRKLSFPLIQRRFLVRSTCRMAAEISKTVFVAETGADQNEGTEAAPFKTILAALLANGENVSRISY